MKKDECINKLKQSKNKIIYIIIILMLSTFLETIVFNFSYLRLDESQKGKKEISMNSLILNDIEIKNNNITIIGDNPYITFNDSLYVGNLVVNTDDNSDKFTISIDNGKSKNMRTYNLFGKLKKTYSFKINSNLENVKIYIQKTQEENESNNIISIQSMYTDNEYNFNIFRYFALIFIGLVFGYLFILDRNKKKELHTVFLSIMLTFGVLISLLTPPYYTFDERQHFIKAYQISKLDFGIRDGKAIFWPDNTNDFFITDGVIEPYNSYQERVEYSKKFSNNNCSNKLYYKTTASTYLFIPYIPAAIGIMLGNILGLPFIFVYSLGRLFSLFAYTFICYYVIKKVKIAKKLIFLVCLLPAVVYQAGGYSADSMTIAFSVAAVAIFINMLCSKKKIERKDIGMFICAILLATMSKVAYAPLCVLYLGLPKDKFKDKRKGILSKIIVILSSIVGTGLTMGFAILKDVQQWPKAGVSAAGQIKYIIQHVITYVGIVLNDFFDNIYTYFTSAISSLAYSGNLQNIITVFMIIVLFIVAIIDNEEEICKITNKNKIFLALGIVLSWGMVVSALYITFTPVGSFAIDGIQGRYMTPLIFPALLLCKNGNIKINKKINEKLIFAIPVVLLSITIFKILNMFNI